MRGPEPEDMHEAGLHGAELDQLRVRVVGAGPEQAQYAAAGARTLDTLRIDPVAGSLHGPGGGRRMATLDVRSPQVFVAHPRLHLDPVIAGTLPHLPGRVPSAGWDGEPGAASPFPQDG